MIKLPRTIRLDQSDTFVFERPAEPGEWAVPGSFLFWDEDIAAFTGKRRAAFRAGFAGVRTLGHSTLVVVSEASEAEREDAVETLAGHIHERFRSLHAREPSSPGADRLHAGARAFEFIEMDEPEEHADLLGLLGARGS